MELKLEVVLSSSIKRKKPWPRFCWLGKEKESVFLLDDRRLSEINMVSGRTKRKTPKLHPLLNSVVTMASSHNGNWLCGLLVSGELFLWNKDKDLLKTAAAVPEVVHVITNTQGNSTRLSLQVSGDGTHVLLIAVSGQVFLWECMDVRDLTGVRDGTVRGQWAHIQPLEGSIMPSAKDKEASQHTIFIKTEAMGDACLSAFVFTSGKKLIITCLRIQWEECHVRVGSAGYSVHWATKTYLMADLNPPCQPVKSRGAILPAFSPDGQLLAIVLNQRQPKATQVLFVSTQNFVSITSSLGGCGSKKLDIPSKYIRSYWVGGVSWSPGGLFLACVLKRGSLLMLPRLGGLLTLSSSGCSVDFGPAHFLPLHPLVTYRPPMSAGNKEASLSSSSLSVRDVLRQRYSVTWHPRLLYLIVSDGYMATVMRVLDKPSPALLLKTLLKDTSKDLQKASRVLDKSQIHLRKWLETLSCLNLDNTSEVYSPVRTHGPNNADSVFSATMDGSTLPLFLQDQGTLGGTKELLEKVQAFFEEDSDVDGYPAGSHMEDGGHLEFASMFDTLHALDTQTDTRLLTSPDYRNTYDDTERRTPLLRGDLEKIKSKLLTAWAFGLSAGNAVENRTGLLQHTLCCVVRCAALLCLLHEGKKKTSVSTCLLDLLKNLLSFLPWDAAHSDSQNCLGLVVDFSKRLIRLLLTPHPKSHQTDHFQLSSHSLSTALLMLQLVSDSLDHTYSLQQRNLWSSSGKESEQQQLWPSDVHHVPFLQDVKEEKSSCVRDAQPVPQRPSSRLFGVWQWIYGITQQYLEELQSFQGCEGWEQEQHEVSVIMSQIQTALQASGGKLEEGPALLSYPGERLFLCGSYEKSAEMWRSHICRESNKRSRRSAFKEMQLCLALLYCLLSEYRLREAQEFADHMACLILLRAGHQKDNMTSDSLPCSWLSMDLHSDAACAVVQTLGRFMASYFTNQPLHILPAHHVAVLPPLHLPHAPSVGRLVPLCQEDVARAVRQQHLSEVWTVEYAQDLLLLGGLLPETVWLAYHLGDWKTAASLGLAYTNYCTSHFDFTKLRRRELHLPTDLEPESIFQLELECLLGSKSDSQVHRDKDGDTSFSDPLEGEDWDLLQVSIREILKASVMAGVNVLSSPLSSLLDTAKDLCSCLPALVPNGLYLPSPPLYCPQPSPNTQDPVGTMGQFAEVASRHKISGVLQRLLLLLRSARCCHPAAQWYISQLRRARHILHKVKKKYAYPSAPEEERAFPEGLMKFVSRSGFFRLRPKKDSHLDPDIVHTLSCFRELCALCWMLHVRDQLSVSCRKYQAARQRVREEQTFDSPEVRSTSVDAVLWACRLLPFSCFLNAEEIIQDLLLSLVSALPPISLVAEMLVKAFPEEEDSVRVPLREKYNSLLQRLTQCNVLEGEKEDINELMLIVIQDKRRHRRKHLGRLKRHLALPELHLWEKVEEEEDGQTKQGMDMIRQLSLGTTLSTSTLTDCGFPLVCSDEDTVKNTSKATLSEMQKGKKGKKVKGKAHFKKAAGKIDSVIQEGSQKGDTKENEISSPPVVGSWEFEVEDEEYLNFLELFLSYVLEKDSAEGGESGSELPLLKVFSSQLRERELHSLTFDVLTTIHRRQRDAHHSARKHQGNDLPVFRAGCCYKPVKQRASPELQTPSIWSEAPISRNNFSVTSLPGLRAGRGEGLFGLRQQSSAPLDHRMTESLLGSESSPNRSALPTKRPSESLILGSLNSTEVAIELQQGLDAKLEADFPELGRLLEWMVRWADRRVLHGHHGKKKKELGGEDGGTTDDGVVIRVKASAPAVLTSLSLLWQRLTDQLGHDRYTAHIQVPETQLTVSPVLQPEGDRMLERESSVDTGYPGSANTPVTGGDHNLHPEEVSVASCTHETEEPSFHTTPPPTDQDELIFEAQERPSTSQPAYLDDLDITPEKEGKSSDSDGFEAPSSVSSENGLGNINTPETSLKVADLDFSGGAEDTLTSASLPSQVRSLQPSPNMEPQALPTIQPEVEVPAVLTGSPAVLTGPPAAPLSNTPVDPPSLHPPVSTVGPPISHCSAPNPPLLTENPEMRQRLGEDLYRLVQNINYMSLMDVLGASFSNLHLAQQRSSLARSNMNLSNPNLPASHDTNFIPQPNALPVQTPSVTLQTQACVPNPSSNNLHSSQTPACTLGHEAAVHSSAAKSHMIRDQPSTSNDVDGNYQEMQPLSVQAESPETQLRESRRPIPSSQGLLATTENSNFLHSVPVLPPNNAGTQSNPAPQLLGLKLLQLHRPPLPQQNAEHFPQMLQTSNLSKKTEREKRNASSDPKRQLSFNPSHHPTPQRSSAQDYSPLPPAFPALTPAPMQGLRLLQFQPSPLNNITFPKLPVPSSTRPASIISAPVGEAPIKLLHLDSGPKMMVPQAAPPAQMTRLITMEELIRRQNAEEARPRLLRVDSSPESIRRATTSHSLNSSKRKKRRELKADKQGVTFRLNESIILTQEPTKEPENEEPATAEATKTGKDLFIQSASPDTMLTGQKLLDRAVSTSAELHAFASTRKKPPECHDAFTNTEPACPPTLVDKALSVSLSASIPLTQSSGKELFNGETPQERLENLDQHGHQFISVLDLEDHTLHHHLPPRLSPGAQVVTSIRPPSPTSAQLHVLATSVIRNSAAAAEPQPNPDLPQSTTPTDFCEEQPSCSADNRDPEIIIEQGDDEDTSEILKAIKTKSVRPHSASDAAPAVWFSSRLSEMDSQLAALQNIADCLEMDFSNSRMLVNRIEKLKPVSAPDLKAKTTVKKTVRLSVPQEAWMPQLDSLSKTNAREVVGEEEEEEEDEENLEEGLVVHNESLASESKPFLHYSTSSLDYEAGPSHLLTTPKVTDGQSATSGLSPGWTDENLGQTGLSDTAEILDELVKEGYISLSDLDWSHSQTTQPDRLEQQSSGMSQKRVRSEDERRELRIWMRRKQREQHAVYQKHRQSLREREHKPFTTSGTAKSPNRDGATDRRTKEEKEKFMLLEKFNQRTREACSLAGDFPVASPNIRFSSLAEASPVPSVKRPISAPLLGSTYSVSANDKRSLKSAQAQPNLRPWTAEAHRLTSEEHHRRLGLHRPVTSLPRDRLSQVTRRGLITNTQGRTIQQTSNQSEGQHVLYKRKTGPNKSPSRGTAAGRGILRETRMEEMEEGNLWEPTSDINRRLGQEDKAGLSDEQEDGARGGVSDFDWLDNLSETGSSLSKIDWAAIERMVAAEEP